MTEMGMSLAEECNIRISGWDLDCIITSLEYRVDNDIDTFPSTIKHIRKLAKVLEKRKHEIFLSYMEWNKQLEK